MAKKTKTKEQVLYKIISERQPIRLNAIADLALCYKVFDGWSRIDLYELIRKTHNVDYRNNATLKLDE